MDLKSLKRRDRSFREDIPKLQRRRTSEWSDRVEAPDQEEEPLRGIISRMYHCISHFCQDVLHVIADSKAQQTEPMLMSLYRLLNTVYTSFITWGDDFEVACGNLDDALKDAQDLRQFTIEILIRICETLTTDLLPAMLQILRAAQLGREQDYLGQRLQSKAGDVELIREQAMMHVQFNPDPNDKPKDDGDSTIAHSDDSSLEDVLENLKSDVDALIELGPCLEDPIQDTLVDEAPASPPQVTAENYKYQTFFEGITQKFPQCDDDLARALSKAFYDTMMRLHLERQTASCEAEVTSKLPKDSGYGTSLMDSRREPETFHESSVATGSSYAQTLASYADVDDGTTKTPFPSQPKDLKIGETFRCVACGRQVAKSESGAAWRRHLLSDLRPWVCCQVSCDCPRTPYYTRDEWLNHLQAQHEVHPHWNDKKCPFCLRFIAAGGREMIRHVERHLRQLSLAALTANPEDDNEDRESEYSDVSSSPGGGDAVPPGHPDQKPPRDIETLKDHPLYTHAVQGDDGLWHCPWEGEGYCSHKPSVLRGDFDKFVMFHFESLRCKVEGCNWSSRAFATQEILYLHEQKEHGLHKGGGRFLCTSGGCGRSRPGNGFANKWVQLEHIRNVHENIPDLPPLPDDS